MSAVKTDRRVTADKSFSLKDRLFNADTVELLAQGLKRADAKFPAAAYKQEVLRQIPRLELKACIDCMADALHGYLPTKFRRAAAVLAKALPAPLDPTLGDNDFGHFIWAVPSEFAARHGQAPQDLHLSLSLLYETTQRFSAEFAIRPFLKNYPDETYEFLKNCANSKNYHVRRLASEGIRPMLPWGQRVDLPVERIISMLDTLHADSTRFVTRSVANNLNDVSKTQPAIVLAALKRWAKAGKQRPAELDWITRHALRSLIKADHQGALAMLGYPVEPLFVLQNIECPATLDIGETLDWRATLISRAEQKLKVLLRVHFLKANGTHSSKVFALKDIQVVKGDVLELGKRLPFKAMTTRALYPGIHHVELVVNGVARGKASFLLRA